MEVIYPQLATAIDGEGSLSVIRHRKTKWLNYTPQIQISNKSKEWLEYFSKLGFQKIQPIKWKNRTYYRITMRNREKVLFVLKLIIPYLIIKRKQAELLIEFCESRNTHTVGAYTDREMEIRKEIFMMNITGRGHLKKFENYDMVLRTKHQRGRKRCPD